jgi:arsenate reductase-like glutaredoxin family protein
MSKIPTIKLYGAQDCHKTKYYQDYLNIKRIKHLFLDIRIHNDYAEELRNLYENRKLNFPTITIGEKKLRNPTDQELNKWIEKLIKSI